MRKPPPIPISRLCGSPLLSSSPCPPVAPNPTPTPPLTRRLTITILSHLPYPAPSCRPWDTAATEAVALTFSRSMIILWPSRSSSLWFFFTACSALLTVFCSSWYHVISLRPSFCSAPHWSSLSPLICLAFIHLPSLRSDLLCSLISVLPTPIYSLYIGSAQLWYLCSCYALSALLSWIG